MDGFFVAVGLVSFCCVFIGDLDLVLMRSVRGSIRGREGGRFVFVVVVVAIVPGCGGGGTLTSSGSGREGSGLESSNGATATGFVSTAGCSGC
jgi:hypothetical protein